MEETRPVGRPTDYKPEYCEAVVEFMAKGYSIEAFAGFIGVTKQTIYNWKESFPEFLDAVQLGTAKCQYWWEQQGNTSLHDGKNFSDRTWKFNMQNRFKWKDRQDVTSDDEKIGTIADLTKKAEEYERTKTSQTP